MILINTLIAWLHLLATVTWIGGMVFMNFVLTPPATARGIPPGFIRLMGMSQFRKWAWGSIVVLLATGVATTFLKGFVNADILFSTTFGRVLLAKHVLITAMIAITALISLVFYPRVAQAQPKPGTPMAPGGQEAMKKIEGPLVFLSRTNVVLGMLVLLAVAYLTS